MTPSQEPRATDPGVSRNNPSEFKLARQRTRHSAADVAKALGVSRSTVSRWESGELEPPHTHVEWLWLNRNQYPSNPRPLTDPSFDGNGKREPRGISMRPERDLFLLPQTLLAAKAAEAK